MSPEDSGYTPISSRDSRTPTRSPLSSSGSKEKKGTDPETRVLDQSELLEPLKCYERRTGRRGRGGERVSGPATESCKSEGSNPFLLWSSPRSSRLPPTQPSHPSLTQPRSPYRGGWAPVLKFVRCGIETREVRPTLWTPTL